MDVLAPDPQRLDTRDLVVRERAGGALGMAALLVALGAGWVVGAWVVLGASPWLAAGLSLGMGLPVLGIGLVLARGALRVRPGRWTLRVGRDAVWLCARSYLNQGADRAPAPWLRIGLDELLAVRAGEQRAHVPDGEGGLRRVTDRWLDLELKAAAPEAARRAVDDERAERSGWRFHAYPLEWRGERTLRVYWQTSGVLLGPKRERVFDALPRRLRSEDDVTRAELPEPDALTPEAVDALARDLNARGRVLDAVRLLRVQRGWTLAHARNWLRDQDDAAA